jgi:hypothetical protein
MKYAIREEGGFLGFPRDYIGDLPMENREAEQLLSVIKEGGELKANEIVDGLQYTIQLEHRGERYSAAFDEKNLPETIREFLGAIRDNR